VHDVVVLRHSLGNAAPKLVRLHVRALKRCREPYLHRGYGLISRIRYEDEGVDRPVGTPGGKAAGQALKERSLQLLGHPERPLDPGVGI
jgi:hypothetical protein